MTKPLIPPEVDLRGMPYMPLDVNRLRDSQLAISASGDEFRAAVLLWCACWNQTPAASLPPDDQTLAAYAGYGRDLKSWKKVKEGAMRGFVMCEDGRWYHPVVAEKALQAWEERQEYQDKRENESERMKRHREEHKAIREQLRGYGITAAWNAKIEALREMLQNAQQQRANTEPETRTGALPETANKRREGKGREGIKDQEQKLPTTSGASAPEPADPIFGEGLAFLIRKGVAEKGARSFLGAMRKELRDDLVAAELLIEAERQDVSEPLAWLRAAGRKRATASLAPLVQSARKAPAKREFVG